MNFLMRWDADPHLGVLPRLSHDDRSADADSNITDDDKNDTVYGTEYQKALVFAKY